RLRLPLVPVTPRAAFAAALRQRIEQPDEPADTSDATVRYFVNDIDAAVRFYRDLLGFEEELRPSPVFAMLYRGTFRLLLNVPGRPHQAPDGTLPEPGGWNRIALRVPDLEEAVGQLRARGADFRNE